MGVSERGRHASSDILEFRILGPLDVRVRGNRVEVKSHRVQVVLSLLLAEAGRVVSVDRLVDAVWDDRPPLTAKTQVQICVSSLRRMLAGTGIQEEVVTTHSPGYELLLGDAFLDADRFRRLVEVGKSFLAAGNAAGAVDHFRAALALWQGPCLEGVSSRVVEATALRLDEQRWTIHGGCVDLELALGRHNELVPELAGLAAEHPLREHLRAQLMLALWRSGRQAEALEVYRSLHRLMTEELGIEPRRGIQRLHQRILNTDQRLEVSWSDDPGDPRLGREAGIEGLALLDLEGSEV